MNIVSAYAVPLAYIPAPKIAISLKLLRDGEITPSAKRVLVYRDWGSVSKVEMCFYTQTGSPDGLTNTYMLDLATVLAQGDWLFTAVDREPPKRTIAQYVHLEAPAVLQLDIAAVGSGGGGGVPARIPARVRVDRQSIPREVVVVERLPNGDWRVAGNLTTAEGDVELRVQGGQCYAMAIDDFGVQYEPNLAVSVGQTVRPTNFVGWLYRITEAGTLPAIEPEWWPVLGDNAPRLLGTARAEAVRYYRPQAFGPEPVEIL